jgi:hypothetical protein
MEDETKRFEVTFTHVRWTCGDGCCSDSGYEVELLDRTPMEGSRKYYTVAGDWNYCSSRDRANDIFEDFMIREFQIPPDKIKDVCEIVEDTREE